MKKSITICLIIAVLLVVEAAQARPDYAWDAAQYNQLNSCTGSGCHSAASTGRMSINSTHDVNLGSGSLKTFSVAAGKKVTLSMNVLNGATKYSVQLKNMEAGGAEFSALNKLIWSPVNFTGNVWVKQQNLSPLTPPYYTKEKATNAGIAWTAGQAPVTHIFDMQVDVNTPIDTYKLTFAVAGQTGDWYQEENIYLEVLCAYDLPGDTNGDCKINMFDLALMAQDWLVDCVKIPRPADCILK